MSKALLWLVLVLCLSFLVGMIHDVQGVSSSQVPRVFYLGSTGPVTLSTPGTLTSLSPLGTCPSCIANLTITPISFAIPGAPVTSLTLQGPLRLNLWVDYRFNNTFSPLLQGSFSYHPPGVNTWTNSNSTQRIPIGWNGNLTVDLQLPTTQLIEQSSLALEVSVASLPKNATISLQWGSSAAPSQLVIPMSGYESISPSNPITILDVNMNHGPFYLNAQPPLIEVKAQVQSAFGFQDIRRVNMTILDPTGHGVAGATNQTMYTSPLATGSSCPCNSVGSWQYNLNSIQGFYQVSIDIIDVQGNIAYASLPTATTFQLVPVGYVPFPYNLIPYLIVGSIGGAGAIGGLALYRKRRKSYLVPFEHFNTLTGGGLNGGTVVTVEGNTGSGKTLLLEQLMGDDLRNARPCVFVSTGEFPSNIRSNMKAMGIDVSGYEQNGLLTFVDGYSGEAGQESREKVSVPSLGDLTTLGIKISSALPSPSFKGGSLYFDSLTPLASKAKPESLVSFVQSVGAKVKGLSGKAFFTIGLGVDQTVQRQLEDTADCIVQMEAFEESGTRRRRLRIAKFRAHRHQEGWAVFTIEEGKGIIFYSKTPKQ